MQPSQHSQIDCVTVCKIRPVFATRHHAQDAIQTAASHRKAADVEESALCRQSISTVIGPAALADRIGMVLFRPLLQMSDKRASTDKAHQLRIGLHVAVPVIKNQRWRPE